MFGWGRVIAFEAQERIYYALAGNVCMNNCFNAEANFAAVGAKEGFMLVPSPNYFIPSSFESLEIQERESNEYIGQNIDYSPEKCKSVKVVSIDSLNLERLDFVKIDIEGMEIEARNGSRMVIDKFKPQFLVERLKSSENEIGTFLREYGYRIFSFGINVIAIHNDDPALQRINGGS